MPNLAVAIAIGMAWIALVEGLVAQVVGTDVARWLPLSAGQALESVIAPGAAVRIAERCCTVSTAFKPLAHNVLRVAPSTKGDLERETGLEPATFSFEGQGRLAQWHPSWEGECSVSSYRVFVWLRRRGQLPTLTAQGPHDAGLRLG